TGQRLRFPNAHHRAGAPVPGRHVQHQGLAAAPDHCLAVPGKVSGQEREAAPWLGYVLAGGDCPERRCGGRAHASAWALPPCPAGAEWSWPAAGLAFSGVASTAASLRWAAVIGAGAPVSGPSPPPDVWKAMTSRMEAAPASSATIRSQPKAIPPCGGAP